MTTLLIDADIVAFAAARVSQRDYQFPGCEVSTFVDDPEVACERADDLLDQWVGTLKLRRPRIIVCLSDTRENGWRRKVLPTYKAHRDGAVDPELRRVVKEHLMESHESYFRPTLEGDDVMGILSTHPTLFPGPKVIVSTDKDMKTVPGLLLNPDKDKHPRLITEEEANYWHLYQTLMGDRTDGYAGCPGIGPKKAEKALHAPNGERLGAWSAWQAVVAHFEAKGLTEQDALTQARVARICRWTDYDYRKKEVILWTPTPDSSPRRPTTGTA